MFVFFKHAAIDNGRVPSQSTFRPLLAISMRNCPGVRCDAPGGIRHTPLPRAFHQPAAFCTAVRVVTLSHQSIYGY